MSFVEVFAIALVAVVFVLVLFIGTIVIMNYADEKRKLRRLKKKALEKYLYRGGQDVSN